MSCVTSMSRMTYAFSRDRAVPGWRLWSKVDRNGTPVNAIIGGCRGRRCVLTLPALYKSPAGVPVAFYAVVSVAVIGLYLAFLIPICAAAADGRPVRARPVDARAASTRCSAGSRSSRSSSSRSTSSCRSCRPACPCNDGLHLAVGELRADRGRRCVLLVGALVGAVGPQVVHRPASVRSTSRCRRSGRRRRVAL